MGKIKTKDVVNGTIKQFDRAAIVSDRMKRTYTQVKKKAEITVYPTEANPEDYASEHIESSAQSISQRTIYQAEKTGYSSIRHVKNDFTEAKKAVQDFRTVYSEKMEARRNIKTHEKQKLGAELAKEQGHRWVDRSARARQKENSSRFYFQGRQTVKPVEESAKRVSRPVRRAEKEAHGAAKAADKTVQAAKTTAKEVEARAKTAGKVTSKAIKAIIASTKALVTAIAAGGWIAVMIIVIIMLISLLAGSVYGIFFSGEDSGTGLSMPMAVQEINADYNAKIEAEKASVSYDSLEVSGSRAAWKEVLAVYAVKVNTSPDSPQEVATMDNEKKHLLSNIFWDMNNISSYTETSDTTVTVETDDGHGNILTTETTETTTTLYITVSHKTAEEMAVQYEFTQQQKDYLADLLSDENNQLWSTVLYGIGYSDNQIVTVALSQIGNYGGAPYWGWYGFNSHVEWCACFVSWCANECGYIDDGIIPKFAGCVYGTQWFKDKGQWVDNSVEPTSGMIIFFDWDNRGGSGPQDGLADHVGIVEKVESGTVYTVEGNSGDSVKVNTYPVGHYEILGYGVPRY